MPSITGSVRDAHAEGQTSPAEGLGGGDLLGQREGMARVGGHDSHSELDPCGLRACHREHVQCIDSPGEMHGPRGREAIFFGLSSLFDDVHGWYRALRTSPPMPIAMRMPTVRSQVAEVFLSSAQARELDEVLRVENSSFITPISSMVMPF